MVAPHAPAARRHWTLTLLALGSPLLWSVHFVLIYMLVSFACSPLLRNSALGGSGVGAFGTLAVTLIGAVGALGFGWFARRSHASEENEDRLSGFLYQLAILLSILFAFGMCFEGAAAVALRPCL